MRDADGLLVGWGMGTATFPAMMFEAQARMRSFGPTAPASMETGAHDMGQGAWTALAQIAADGLALDIDEVDLQDAGPRDLPNAGIAGGSAHTATAGGAIHAAGQTVIAQAGRPRHGGRPRLPALRRRQRRRDRPGRAAAPPRRREPQREPIADILARAGRR